MKKGTLHTFKGIEEFADINDFEIENLGTNRIGENFLILRHKEKDITLSFCLLYASGSDYMYECVYSDIK